MAIFQFLAPKELFGGLAPIWVRWCKLHFPLSFGKSFMKIRSAVPENGCLIFMHYLVTDRKRMQKAKNICKTHTHSHPLAAQMSKQNSLVINTKHNNFNTHH